MIDLHCHILPGLDDGAFSTDDSLKMASVAVKNGTSAVSLLNKKEVFFAYKPCN